jgi:hypothetical protein
LKSGKSEASARESVGGASEVHYGYFSNVRSDSYRSGWDDIWDAKHHKKKMNKRDRSDGKRKLQSREDT